MPLGRPTGNATITRACADPSRPPILSPLVPRRHTRGDRAPAPVPIGESHAWPRTRPRLRAPARGAQATSPRAGPVERVLRGQGLAEYLLLDALHRACVQSAHIGAFAIVVDPIDESAVRFYEHFDFIRLPDRRDRLFLPMKTVAALFPHG